MSLQGKKGFLVEVQQRDAATLLPIIQQWVAPGSTVWSDMWAAYRQLPNLPQNYQHGTVNHTINFIDPNTGVTTNRVEAMWQRAKSTFKAQQGPTNRDMVAAGSNQQRYGGGLLGGVYGVLALLRLSLLQLMESNCYGYLSCVEPQHLF